MWGTLVQGFADFVANAAAVFEQVQDRLTSEIAIQAVEVSRSVLGEVRNDLERISEWISQMDERSSWVLNPRWHPVVFQVASSRETILLTVALNAVRVVSESFDRILQDRWPPAVQCRLTTQRERLTQVEETLLEARSQLTRVGASEFTA